jgi:hypothetical protein
LQELLPKPEFEALFLPDAKIYKILEELRSKFGIYSFTRYIGYLTINNEEFLKIVLGFIFSGLKEFQSKRYRQFVLLAEEIISIQDDLKELRFESLKRITEALKFNEQYSSDSNIIQQWIVILLNRNANLRAYLTKEAELLAYLVGLTTKKVPSDDIARKNVLAISI